MTLGVGSYTWPWAVARGELSAAQIAARAADAGFGVAQLCDNLGLDAIARDLDRLRTSGVTIELGGRGLATLPQWLDLAEALSSPLVRLVIDTADHHPTPEEAVDALAAFVPRLERAGIVLAIENHDRFPAAILASLVAAVGSGAVGVCLDTANSIGAGEGLETVLDRLAPHTRCLHLKDIAIRRVSHQMGFTVDGAPPGRGLVDGRRAWDAVAAHGLCRSVVLEQWPAPDDEDNWAQEGIAWLRRLAQGEDS